MGGNVKLNNSIMAAIHTESIKHKLSGDAVFITGRLICTSMS